MKVELHALIEPGPGGAVRWEARAIDPGSDETYRTGRGTTPDAALRALDSALRLDRDRRLRAATRIMESAT